MYRFRQNLYRSLVFSLLSLPAFSQDFLVDVQLFTSENGLPFRAVNCISQDDRGFIWVGTRNGMARFDGQLFEPVESDGSLLNSGSIDGIKKDAKGHFWISEEKEGVIRYDPLRRELLEDTSAMSRALRKLKYINPLGGSQQFFFEDEQRFVFHLDRQGRLKAFGGIQLQPLEKAFPTNWGTLLILDRPSLRFRELDSDGRVLRTFDASFDGI